MLRQRQFDRGGKRPVTFYLGYLPPAKVDRMASTQYRRSLSDMTINASAMLACWKKVHGGSHDIEKRKSETIEEESDDGTSVELPSVDLTNTSSVTGHVHVDRPMKPKTVASRQSSCPGLRERTLLQNEAKRMSMPLPLLYKKEMVQRQLEQIERAAVKVEAVTDMVRQISIDVHQKA